jgi:porphobilinogen deaminase
MPDRARLIRLFELGREGVMACAVRIGTRGSPLARWQAEWVAGQLRRHHPDRDVALVEIQTRGGRDQNSPSAAGGGIGVRGNVETRLDRAFRGRLDAVVLAEAGLRRLGLDRHITQRLAPPAFLPAVAQGAIGLECRADDVALRALVAPLDDAATHRAVRAERRVLAELEGGCMIPLAAWARDAGGELVLDVAVFDLDGRERIAASAAGPREDPDDLGRQVARDLRVLGAGRLLRPIARP